MACRRQFSPRLRIPALILCVTFSLTQAAPAWAMRAEGVASPLVRQELQGGLEETGLQSPNPVAPAASRLGLSTADFGAGLDIPKTILPAPTPTWAVPALDVRQLTDLLIPHAAAFFDLREQDRNVPAFIRLVLADLRVQQKGKAEAVPFTVPSESAVADMLTTLERKHPHPGQACWLRAGIRYFGEPERAKPEAAQSENFNGWERLLALGMVAEWLLNGQITTQRDAEHGDVTPTISLAALQAAINAVLGEVSESGPWLTRRGMDIGQLQTALAAGHGVMAHVGGNHVVAIREVTEREVVYQDDLQGEPQRKSHAEFLEWWNESAVRGAALTTAAPAGPDGLLAFDQAKGVLGGCGAYLNSVRAGGLAAALLALLKFEYRGRDNAGLLWLDETGAHRWISIGPGAVRNLVRRIYRSNEVREAHPHGTQPHALSAARRRLMSMEGVATSAMGAAESRDLTGTDLNRLFLVDPEGHPVSPPRRIALTLGDTGSMHAGAQYRIDDGMEIINTIAREYRIVPDIVKMFIRFELEQLLGDSTNHPLVRVFDRLVERVRTGTLDRDNQVQITDQRWVNEEEAWSEVVTVFHRAGKPIVTVPAAFNRDTVRESFRMQAGVVGTFRVHPDWRKAVEAIFSRRMTTVTTLRPGLPSQDWLTRWEEEKAANIVGLAHEAFNEWMRQHFHEMGRIHPTVWKQEGYAEAYAHIARDGSSPQDDRLVGRFDGMLAELIGQRVLGHGRWGMSGGIFILVEDVKLPDPAHPHPDDENVHWVCHNGLVAASVYEPIRAEHEAAGISYLSETGQAIRVDTKEIANHWSYLVKLFREYYDGWKRRPSAEALTRAGLPSGTAERVHRRFEKWNEIAARLLENQGISEAEAQALVKKSATWDAVAAAAKAHGLLPPSTDELAHRVSTIDLAQGGSQLGVTTYSAHDPFTDRLVSENRGIAIDVWNGIAAMGSDDVVGLSLFPPEKVDAAARRIREIRNQTVNEIFALRAKVKDHPNPAADELTLLEFYQQALTIYTASLDQIHAVEAPFAVDITYLRNRDNYAKVWRVIDEHGRPATKVEVTTFDGHPKDIQPQGKVISPSVADKGPFSSFMDAHIDAVPWVVLQIILQYMSVATATTVADIQPSVGSDPVSRTPQATGLHWEAIEAAFGGLGLPQLQRLVLGGIGSARFNVDIARALAEAVLPPRVDVESLDTATGTDLLSDGFLKGSPGDWVMGNSQSGTTASTEMMMGAMQQGGALLTAVTGQLASAIGQMAQASGGALDALGDTEIMTATYMKFIAQSLVLALTVLEAARRMGAPPERLAAYVGDILRLPTLMTEATYSQPHLAAATQVARATTDHNKSLMIGSMNNPFLLEVKIKDNEQVGRPARALDYQDDWEVPLRNAARDGKTTVYLWATDPERLDEANEVLRAAQALGLKVVMVAFQDDNPYYSAWQAATPHFFAVPRLTGVLQAIVDNPIIIHIVRAVVRARGRTDEETDWLFNLAKSVTVFPFSHEIRKMRVDPEEFAAMWQTQRSRLPKLPWRAYLEWRAANTAVAAGLEETNPQRSAIADLPALLHEINKTLLLANGQIAVESARRVREKFGDEAEKLQRIVIVTDQEPLRYAAMETRLDFPELLGIQVNQVKVVSAYSPSVRRYIQANDTLVILLSQSRRDLSDRRVSPRDPVPTIASFKNEQKLAALAGALQAEGVAVLAIADANSSVIPVGRSSIGSIVVPPLTDTAAKMVTDLVLDAVGIQLGRIKFETGEPRARLDRRAAVLQLLPEFLAHHVVANPEFSDQIQSAAVAVALYEKHLVTGGGQAEQSAYELTRTLGLYSGMFGQGEAAHSALHGPLEVTHNDPRKFLRWPDGSVTISHEYDVARDTAWLVVANGNEPMSAEDIRDVVTRSGAVIVIAGEQLARTMEMSSPKNLGALEVIRVPDVPQLVMKYLDHMVGNLLVAEIARHHTLLQQVEKSLEGVFKPHIGHVTEMLALFENTGKPQFVPVQDPANEKYSYLFIVGKDRPMLARDVLDVVSGTDLGGGVHANIEEQSSSNPAGFRGAMLYHLNQPAEVVERLRTPVLDLINGPSSTPPVAEPDASAPSERAELTYPIVTLPLTEALLSLEAFRSAVGAVADAYVRGPADNAGFQQRLSELYGLYQQVRAGQGPQAVLYPGVGPLSYVQHGQAEAGAVLVVAAFDRDTAPQSIVFLFHELPPQAADLGRNPEASLAMMAEDIVRAYRETQNLAVPEDRETDGGPAAPEQAGLEEAATAAQATAAMRGAYEQYKRLYQILQSSSSPPFQQVPTLADVETTLLTRGVKEQRFLEVHGALLAKLGGPILTIKDAEGPDGDTVRAMRKVLLDAATALAPLVPPPGGASAGLAHYAPGAQGGLEEISAVPTATVTRSPAAEGRPITITVSPNPAVTVTTVAPRLTAALAHAGPARPVVGREIIAQSALAVLAGEALNDFAGLALAYQWPASIPVVLVAENQDHEAVIREKMRGLPVDGLQVVQVGPGSIYNPDGGVPYAEAAQRVAEAKAAAFREVRLFVGPSLATLIQFLKLPAMNLNAEMVEAVTRITDGFFA